MSANEVFDIFTSNMERIGTATRREVHAQGLWHQTFQCWIVHTSPSGERSLLFQMRHPGKDVFPGLLDISCAGHLLAGESVEDGVRELEEELGLAIPFGELIPCGVFPEEDILSEQLIDREFCHVYLYECSRPLNEYVFQRSEITGIYLINLDVFTEMLDGKRAKVSAEGIALGADDELHVVSQEYKPDDFVPHPRAYFDMLLRKIQNLSAMNR